MANIFNNSFEDGEFHNGVDYAPYNGLGGGSAVAGRGCVGGYAMTCYDGVITRISTPNIGDQDPVSGTPATLLLASTHRFEYSLYSSSGIVPDFGDYVTLYGTSGWRLFAWNAQQWSNHFGGTESGNRTFVAVLLAQTDGSLQLFIKDVNAPDGKGARFLSTVGVFPSDGTMHGFQVSFNFTSATQVEYNVVVNNVSVLSGTYTTAVGLIRCWQSSYGHLSSFVDYPGLRETEIWSTYQTGLPPMGTTALMSACGNVQVDNAVSIIDYPACSAPTNTILNACVPIVPAVVYGASFNGPCGSGGHLTIKGSHFDADYSDITVLDPDGDPVEFEVVFLAPTLIVLNIVTFVTGKYCVTVVNFNMEPQDPVCARLCYTTYPTRRTRRFPLPFDRNLWLYVDRIEWLIQNGVGLSNPPGNDPQIMVRFSQDGGMTYGNELTVPAGKIGEYLRRSVLNRIGKFQNGFCEISMSDAVLWALMECWVDVSQSTN